MSESIEPSYYEISLTSRQVVITFVILLTLVLAIFLCGVWVGKNGSQRLAGQGAPTGAAGAAGESPEQLANMEEFKFFAEEGNTNGGSVLAESRNGEAPRAGAADRPAQRPPQANSQAAPPQSTPDPAPSTQTAPSQSTQAPPPPRPAQAAPPKAQPAPPKTAPPKTAPPKTQPAAAQPAAEAGDGFVVQVFSTRDEAQARKVLGELKGAGHRAFLSAVEVTGQTMYRVRVGPFNQRGDADKVAKQVRRQMKLDPWVTAAGN